MSPIVEKIPLPTVRSNEKAVDHDSGMHESGDIDPKLSPKFEGIPTGRNHRRVPRTTKYERESPQATAYSGGNADAGLAASRWSREYVASDGHNGSRTPCSGNFARRPGSSVSRQLTDEERQIAEDVSSAMQLFDQDLIAQARDQRKVEEDRIKKATFKSYFIERPVGKASTMYGFNLSTGEAHRVNAVQHAREQAKQVQAQKDEIGDLQTQVGKLLRDSEKDKATIDELAVHLHDEMEETRMARAELVEARKEAELKGSRSSAATDPAAVARGRRDTGYWSVEIGSEDEKALLENGSDG